MRDLRVFVAANNLDGAKLMPVRMTPPVPPDNRMAELDALLRRRPQDATKRQVAPRAAPAYLTVLAAELRAKAVARAAHARECRKRLIQQRAETTKQHRREAAANARKVNQERNARQECEMIHAALESLGQAVTQPLENRFAAFRMLTGAEMRRE